MSDYSLIKSFSFEAAHFLPNVPEGHKCGRIHGHSFQCDIEVRGPLNEQMGWLMDYGDIKKKYKPIREQLDHHFLNEHPELKNPTSENICKWIWKELKPQLPELYSVSIRETCTSKCVYRG